MSNAPSKLDEESDFSVRRALLPAKLEAELVGSGVGLPDEDMLRSEW